MPRAFGILLIAAAALRAGIYAWLGFAAPRASVGIGADSAASAPRSRAD